MARPPRRSKAGHRSRRPWVCLLNGNYWRDFGRRSGSGHYSPDQCGWAMKGTTRAGPTALGMLRILDSELDEKPRSCGFAGAARRGAAMDNGLRWFPRRTRVAYRERLRAGHFFRRQARRDPAAAPHARDAPMVGSIHEVRRSPSMCTVDWTPAAPPLESCQIES
jgi:hypothetical protein